jgi:hypothetical protein
MWLSRIGRKEDVETRDGSLEPFSPYLSPTYRKKFGATDKPTEGVIIPVALARWQAIAVSPREPIATLAIEESHIGGEISQVLYGCDPGCSTDRDGTSRGKESLKGSPEGVWSRRGRRHIDCSPRGPGTVNQSEEGSRDISKGAPGYKGQGAGNDGNTNEAASWRMNAVNLLGNEPVDLLLLEQIPWWSLRLLCLLIRRDLLPK